jgi:hypothetical protein
MAQQMDQRGFRVMRSECLGRAFSPHGSHLPLAWGCVQGWYRTGFQPFSGLCSHAETLSCQRLGVAWAVLFDFSLLLLYLGTRNFYAKRMLLIYIGLKANTA